MQRADRALSYRISFADVTSQALAGVSQTDPLCMGECLSRGVETDIDFKRYTTA